MRALWITVISLGAIAVVLGVGSFVFGAWVLEGKQGFRFGELSGAWSEATYVMVGTMSAALGAGLITAGTLAWRAEEARERRHREEQAALQESARG